MGQKSLVEQALLQMETLEEVVKQNSKGILASAMKQELNGLLKEAIEKENPFAKEDSDDEVDDVTGTTSDDENPINDELPSDDDTETESPDEEGDEDETEPDNDADDEMLAGDEEIPGEDDDDTLDMTGASDDEVLKVFKAMGPNDGIVVKKEGNKLELNINDEDYIIKLEEQDVTAFGGKPTGDDFEGGDDIADEPLSDEGISDEEIDEMIRDYQSSQGGETPGNDETIYEIELDEEDPESQEGEMEEGARSYDGRTYPGGSWSPKDKGKVEKTPTNPEFMKGKPQAALAKKEVQGKEGEQTESARTMAFGYRGGLSSKNTYKSGNKRDEVGSGKVNEEIEILRKQNDEYKKALYSFKEKLNEVAVFNANLAYAVRLFTENTTTKQEKLDILKKFDSVSTITESKKLYESMKIDLGSKKTVTETVSEKISITPQTSGSSEVLAESKAYENPQFKRIKDLMNKVNQ